MAICTTPFFFVDSRPKNVHSLTHLVPSLRARALDHKNTPTPLFLVVAVFGVRGSLLQPAVLRCAAARASARHPQESDAAPAAQGAETQVVRDAQTQAVRRVGQNRQGASGSHGQQLRHLVVLVRLGTPRGEERVRSALKCVRPA